MEYISGGLLSAGIAVTGSLAAKGPMTIAGTIAGDVVCEGKLIVTGHVTGRIMAPEADISGLVGGDISVPGILLILAGAKVTGDIAADTLSVEETAAVNGRLSVGRERVKAGEERLAAFEARLRALFPPPKVLEATPDENLPEAKCTAGDTAGEARRQKLINAADKLKAQKGKKQKPGAGRPT